MIPYRVAFGNARPGREVLGPSTGAERIEIADALRGFAVCGILVANILYFKPIGNVDGPALDRLVEAVVMVFAQGKFFTIFSLLFGYGIAVQLGRAERQGWTDRFPRLLVRRLLVLGVIGAAHFALLSVARKYHVEDPYVRHVTKLFDLLTEAHGLGLMFYAVTGLVLVCVRGARPAVLVRWAIGIVAVTAAISALLLGILELARAYGDAELAQGRRLSPQGLIRYGGSSFHLPRIAFYTIFYAIEGWVMLAVPTVLAMFMAGFAAGRCGMLRRLAENRSSMRRVCAWSLAVGLPLAALAFAGICLSGLSAWMAIWFNRGAAGPIMAIGYCAGIALLWQRPAWRRWLHPLTWLGRMALTNYLLQSAIAAALFLGYGLVLWMVSPAQAWLIAAAILAAQLAAQMAASRWWLRRYRFGPAEWLWRTLTYGQTPPMRVAATPPPIER